MRSTYGDRISYIHISTPLATIKFGKLAVILAGSRKLLKVMWLTTLLGPVPESACPLMLGPSSIAPQVPRNPDGEFSQNALEEEQKEVSVEISDQLDFKPENNGGGHMPRAPLFVSSTSQPESIVTRSVVLIAHGVSFAVSSYSTLLGFYVSNWLDKIYRHCKVMISVFTIFDPATDYGTFGRWLSFIIRYIICYAALFASTSLTSACLIKPLHKLTALNHENQLLLHIGLPLWPCIW